MYEMYKMINFMVRAIIIPGLMLLCWLTGLISVAAVQICLVVFFLVFVGFPLLFRYSITLQRGILFLTFITYPKDLDLSNPGSVGLHGTRNFYITVRDENAADDVAHDVRIGVWHVLPHYVARQFGKELHLDGSPTADDDETQNDTAQQRHGESDELFRKLLPILKSEYPKIIADNEQLFYERMLKLSAPVVLYLHGNTASRGSGHRVDIYKMLRKLGYHVLTMDYRGYGDSDPVAPTEEGVVRDALAVYEYISNITSNPIFIWGHSLGTGVSTNLCAQLSALGKRTMAPRGLILESPFTNICDEIRMHPFARLFKDLPWFDVTIAKPMYSNSLRFESDRHISEFRQPIMILHAEDDYVVPFQLGYKLYRVALDTRGKSWGPVEFHRFDASHQYGHKYLCRAPELPGLVQTFVENYRSEEY